MGVLIHDDHVRIEVRDGSSHAPVPRSYSETATTGRGLDLVATLSFMHGVDSLDDGKVVWCCINSDVRDAPPASVVEAGEWADPRPEAADREEEAGNDEAVVTLLRMPPTLWLAAREHHDALLRELALIQPTLPAEAGKELASDLSGSEDARARIADAVEAAVEAARRSGAAAVPLPDDHPGELPAVPNALDLRIHVRRDELQHFEGLKELLDRAERLARDERLLARPGLPEIIAIRNWVCDEVIAQVSDSPATPWVGVDDERLAALDAAVPLSDWADEAVRTATTGVIAVDDTNRIVAVSPRLLAVLGWQADDLLGRSVVAIVPPRFRESHIAGFSRHLRTGVARALDVPLRLPVLCFDGTEVDCTFLIRAERTPSGRTVYLASIEPVDQPDDSG